MKNMMLLFALLLVLAACASALATPTSTTAPATETPFPSPTNTLKPTNTLLPTETSTSTSTATPSISRFLVKPASANQFPVGDKSDIAVLLNWLRASGKSLLDPNVEPVSVGQLMMVYGKDQYFDIVCNQDGIINCVPAAYLQFTDEIDGQTRNPSVIIWEMMTKGGPAYLTTEVAEPTEEPYADVNYLLAHLQKYLDIKINVAIPSAKNEEPYAFILTQYPGLADDATTFRNSGTPPLRLQQELLNSIEY